MNFVGYMKRFNKYRFIRSIVYKYLHNTTKSYCCPLCQYFGSFEAVFPSTGVRTDAECPRCGSLERHRLQYLVLEELMKSRDLNQMSCLHIAPENFFRKYFATIFMTYHTADLASKYVDYNFDLCNIPFKESSYDIIYASHVMEHISNDSAALKEIKRILKPGGIAILPVPVVSSQTIEYPEPNPNEVMHVRAPGYDYFQRYEDHFREITVFKSSDFDEKYQTWIYEDRTAFPNALCPLRQKMEGIRHQEYVPVCYV